MIVHFVAPSPSYEQKRGIIELIRNKIVQHGHDLMYSRASDPATMIEMSAGMLDSEDWELLCERDMRLLKEADVVIFEVSDKATFGVGYLAAHALLLNKPSLFLMATGSRPGSFTTGLKHEMLTRKIYDNHNIETIITNFLEAHNKC